MTTEEGDDTRTAASIAVLNIHAQNRADTFALRRVAADLRTMLQARGVETTDPEIAALLADVEALERVAGWIGNRVVSE